MPSLYPTSQCLGNRSRTSSAGCGSSQSRAARFRAACATTAVIENGEDACCDEGVRLMLRNLPCMLDKKDVFRLLETVLPGSVVLDVYMPSTRRLPLSEGGGAARCA